jgi:hypothetical protein
LRSFILSVMIIMIIFVVEKDQTWFVTLVCLNLWLGLKILLFVSLVL